MNTLYHGSDGFGSQSTKIRSLALPNTYGLNSGRSLSEKTIPAPPTPFDLEKLAVPSPTTLRPSDQELRSQKLTIKQKVSEARYNTFLLKDNVHNRGTKCG